jgi:hypothetical protein
MSEWVVAPGRVRLSKMATKYSLLREFGLYYDIESGESISTDPYWVIAVIRFENPVTFDRQKGASFSTLYEDAVRVRGKPLIITDECVQLTTSSTKTNHLIQMQAQLLPGRVDFMSEIMPGDWVFAWMMHDQETQKAVITGLRSGLSCNNFNLGLKFAGRVNGIRELINQDGNVGNRTTRFSLSAVGFTEFDATLFYDPHLAEKVPAIGQYFANLGLSINDLVAKNGRGIDVNKAIPAFVDLLLGKGVPRNLGNQNTDPRLRNTAGLDAPYSFAIPGAVASVFGQNTTGKSGGIMAVSDILEVIWGVQHYDDLEVVDIGGDENTEDGLAGSVFAPSGTKYESNRRFTGKDMMGIFLPTPPQFTNKSIWSILNQYLNPAVNEMFTCLRVNAQGWIVPTLVVRQIPFTSEYGSFDFDVTRFLELPRWVVDPIQVKRLDIGRSEALRINFVHVYGDAGPDKVAPFSQQIVRNPPIRDDLDSARSGLRPYMTTVSCDPGDAMDGSAGKWMKLVADIVMGQHMTLTGMLEIVGVQAPIAVGDNLELRGVVFHIESVSHSCGIEINGRKTFSTTLALSHGVRADPQVGNLGLYAGIREEDRLDLEAVATHDGEDPNRGEKAPALEGVQVTQALADTGFTDPNRGGV